MKTIIYGGAFDPPHLAHREILQILSDMPEVDRILVMPTYRPPHKDCTVSYENRYEMARLSFGDIEKVEISDFESRYEGASYASEMLPRIRDEVGDFYYVIGGDSLMKILNWHDSTTVLRNADLMVFPRGEQGSELFDMRQRILDMSFGRSIEILPYPMPDISSTLLRGVLPLLASPIIPDELSEYLDTIISHNVTEYIKAHQLYTSEYKEYIDKLYDILPERTFRHSLLTTLLGVRLNEKLKLDSRQVFLACLLHDCAKNNLSVMDGVPRSVYAYTPVIHQYTGAVVAQKVFGITDKAILQAIRYHTTSHVAATKLDKLVYMADSLAYGRKYDGLEELREYAFVDFEGAYRRCVIAGYNVAKNSGNPVYYLTKMVYNRLK